MNTDSPAAIEWDNPSPGVYEAHTTRTVPVVLEVFDPTDDPDPDEYAWWALSEGRVIGGGFAPSIDEAKRRCELVAA